MIKDHGKFSVIIPTLNEEANIGVRIDEVRRICPDAEVIVADAGSADRTQEVVREKGVLVIRSPRGRGAQCNAGAKAATGDIFLFLHADTQLPPDAFAALESSFSDKDNHIGTFRLKFDTNHYLLNVFSFFQPWDCIFTRYGDQCITMRRIFFDRLGGFPELEYFEDVELLRKSRKFTKIRLFPATVITSGRRFEDRGVARQYFFNAWLMIQYFFGASPKRLADKYVAFGRSPGKERE